MDDALALRDVLGCIAERLGVSMSLLTEPFVQEFDADATAAQITSLLMG